MGSFLFWIDEGFVIPARYCGNTGNELLCQRDRDRGRTTGDGKDFDSLSRLLRALRSPSWPSCLEVELRADLEEPRLRDRQRIEIRALRGQDRRAVGLLIHIARIGVGHVEDVDGHQRLGASVLQVLAKPEIESVEAIEVLYCAGLDEVEELDGAGAGERPSKARFTGQQERRGSQALIGDGWEIASRIREAVERSADQHVDLRHIVRGEPLVVREPGRLAMAERLRELREATDEQRTEAERTAVDNRGNVDVRVRRSQAA